MDRIDLILLVFVVLVGVCVIIFDSCIRDDEDIIHDIEAGMLRTETPGQPQQEAEEQQKQKKAERVESYEVLRHRKDMEKPVGFHNGECVLCLGAYEEDDECVMLKKCKHTYHRECIDKVKEDSCPICRHSIDIKLA